MLFSIMSIFAVCSLIGSFVSGPNPDDELVGFVVAICSVVIALNNKHYGGWCACLDRPPIDPAWFVVGVWLVSDKGCSFDVAVSLHFYKRIHILFRRF